MCGILGYVSLRRPPAAPAWRAALDCMAYRGPDARAVYLAEARHSLDATTHAPSVFSASIAEDELFAHWPDGPAVLLGHLRLAIIDLVAASDQPMQRGPLTVVFNGEIYNYIELRDELMSLGHSFETHGDTEVILAAYQQWGRDCVQRLRGMFAIALHNSAAGTLWLARDRFAIKPLYVAMREGVLAFASEAKVLPLLLRERAVPDDRALFHLLAYWLNAFDRGSFFQGVEAMLPGEDALVNLATLSVYRRRYYDITERVPELEPLPATDDSIERFRGAFDDAVRIHLRADVPIGVGLSGGLDSSSVLGTIAARHLPGGAEVSPNAAANGELLDRCLAFSSVFEDAEASEGEHIRAVLDYTHIDGRFVTPDFAPLLDKLPELCRLHDGPVVGPSTLVQHSVMQLAKASGVTVVINGQGGDELLCGYLRFIVLHTLGVLKRNVFAGVGLTAEMLMFGDPQIPGIIFGSLLRKRSARGSQRRKSLGEMLQPGRFGRFEPDAHAAPFTTNMQRLREQELQVWPIPALCQNEDRNSMYFSLESRVPLLDHVLAETALRLPPALLFRRGLAKYALRAAMRGRIPDRVRWRRTKLGFPAPEQRWLGAVTYRDFRGRLTAEDRLREVFTPGVLEEGFWDQLDARQRWLLLSVDAWLGGL